MISLLKHLSKIIKLIVLTILIIYFANFVVNNDQYIAINLEPLPFEISTKLFIAMIGFFVFGIVFTLMIAIPMVISHSFREFSGHHKINALEKQLKKQEEKVLKEQEKNKQLEQKISELRAEN